MTIYDITINKLQQLPEPLVKLVNEFIDFLLTTNQKVQQSVQAEQPRPQFGSAKGLIEMSDDFDEPLEDFKEYME
ncbi:MAG: DUF2281 domain-containing protein [Cyanobacteria bacterium P01_A01_bin.114]